MNYLKYTYKFFFANIIICLIAFTYYLSSQSTFSGERIKEACKKYLYQNIPDDAEISISKNIEDFEFVESNVSARFDSKNSIMRGNTYLGIEFLKDNKILKRIEIPVRIKIYKNVPTALRNISRNEDITSNDLTYSKQDVTNYSDSQLITIEGIIGNKAKRNINKGALVCKESIAAQALIKRGEKVSITVQSGTVRIHTTGQALQDAAVGENIRVKRDGTQNILQGQVAMDGTIFIPIR